jgi:hypothetical protein
MSANNSFPQKGLVVPAEDEKDDNMLGMVFSHFLFTFLLQLPKRAKRLIPADTRDLR